MDILWALMSCLLYSFFTVISCTSTSDALETHIFIVSVQNDLKPSEFSDVKDWYISTINNLHSTKNLQNSHQRTRLNNGGLLHVYRTIFHGFSALLTSEQAEELKQRPEILNFSPDCILQVQTARSPGFLGLDSSTTTFRPAIEESDYGNNVIIGFLDTGIWPERHSFDDSGFNPIPSRWKGKCVSSDEFSCNKKIIGARTYYIGYNAFFKQANNETEGDLQEIRMAMGRTQHQRQLDGLSQTSLSSMNLLTGTPMESPRKQGLQNMLGEWVHGFRHTYGYE